MTSDLIKLTRTDFLNEHLLYHLRTEPKKNWQVFGRQLLEDTKSGEIWKPMLASIEAFLGFTNPIIELNRRLNSLGSKEHSHINSLKGPTYYGVLFIGTSSSYSGGLLEVIEPDGRAETIRLNETTHAILLSDALYKFQSVLNGVREIVQFDIFLPPDLVCCLSQQQTCKGACLRLDCVFAGPSRQHFYDLTSFQKPLEINGRPQLQLMTQIEMAKIFKVTSPHDSYLFYLLRLAHYYKRIGIVFENFSPRPIGYDRLVDTFFKYNNCEVKIFPAYLFETNNTLDVFVENKYTSDLPRQFYLTFAANFVKINTSLCAYIFVIQFLKK